MPHDLARLRHLSGMPEPEILPPDQDDDLADAADDQRNAREAHVTALITRVFQRLRIELADDDDYPVIYFEDDGREATVKLADNEIDLASVGRLMSSGLAPAFKLIAGNHELRISFVVAAEMDGAKFS